MKVVPQTVSSCQKCVYVAPIPLERPEKKEHAKEDLLCFKLCSTPAEENSPTYEDTVAIFDKGTLEEVLDFVTDVNRVITGQNIMTGPPKYATMRMLLRGDALAAFNVGAAAAGNETNANFTMSHHTLICHFSPARALALQKRVITRFMSKPKEMDMCTFMGRLTEINNKLVEFPLWPISDLHLQKAEIQPICY